jgi:ribonuclease J
VDIGEEADAALRDRRMLSADGIFVVVATISEQSGESVADPEVMFRGVPYSDDAEKLIDQIRDGVDDSLARAAKDGVHDIDALQSILHDDLAKLVYEKIRRRPMVLPVVVEV